MEKLITMLGSLIGILVLAVIVDVIVAWPVQLLWNMFLVPAVEGINSIGFWQALGITVLFNILFKPSIPSRKNDQ